MQNELLVFFQHGFRLYNDQPDRKGNYIGYCIFCSDLKHFSVKPETKQWKCWKCGKGGGYQQFLFEVAKKFQVTKQSERTVQATLTALFRDRNIDIKTLFKHEVGYNTNNNSYLLPVWDRQHKKVLDIRKYKIGGKLIASADSQSALYNVKSIFDFQKSVIWLCEGHWDPMVMDLILYHKSSVVGAPGAGIFKPTWVEYFKDREVIVVYDNDEAGTNGCNMVHHFLKDAVKKIQFTDWSCLPDLKKGFDVRDAWGQLNSRKGVLTLINTVLSDLPTKFNPKMKIEATVFNYVGSEKENSPKLYSFDAAKLPKMNLTYFFDFLAYHGYKKIIHDVTTKKVTKNNHFYVKIKDNIISHILPEYLYDFVAQEIKNYPKILKTKDKEGDKHCLMQNFLEVKNQWFNVSNLISLNTLKLNQHWDTKDSSFLYFPKCVVEVSSKKVKKLNYDEIKGHIWDTSISKYNFDESAGYRGDFFEFQWLSSGKNIKHLTHRMKCIGFLLHRFRHKAMNKMIVCVDELKDNEVNAGSGKTTTFHQAISEVRSALKIDSQDLNPESPFWLSMLETGIEVVTFDDMRKGFPVNRLYAKVTGDIEIEKKGQDRIIIKHEKAPKLCVTSNDVIKSKEGATKRRIVETLFTNYFHPGETIFDEFGRVFFDDWDKLQWAKFYNFMIKCIQLYLRFGLEPIEYDIVMARKVMDVHSNIMEKIVDFYDKIFSDNWYSKNVLYEKFCKIGGIEEESLTIKVFMRNVKAYAESKKHIVLEKTIRYKGAIQKGINIIKRKKV